jgi:uncharacterized membrane protein
MDKLTLLVAACAAFVGAHFVLSHPLRGALVGRLGDGGFKGLYSLVALAAILWLASAYRAAPLGEPLWPVGDGLWAAATIVMLLASVLLMGSLVRNPALSGPTREVQEARGVFAVTRHPMMWAIALWAFSHIAVFPFAKNIVLCVAMIVLALVGSALQDVKKARAQPDFWPQWQARTSYLPFAAVASGRARFGGFGVHALAGGLVVWLAATWAHIPASGWPAGIWRWL